MHSFVPVLNVWQIHEAIMGEGQGFCAFSSRIMYLLFRQPKEEIVSLVLELITRNMIKPTKIETSSAGT